MFTTPSMGLVAWDLGTDPYDHAQLATNFSDLDKHRHVAGEGLQIPTDGILNAAITSAKIAGDAVVPTTHIPVDSIPQSRLADNSVGPGELQDNAVDTNAIVNGAITADKLDGTVLPIGTVLMWYRGHSSVLPPTGWEVMDGRAWSGITNKMGAAGVQLNAGNIPNMANKFPLGAALAGTGTDPSSPPDLGQAGGQHTRTLDHTHTTQAHSHVVNSHTHTITPDGAHNHTFNIQTPGGPSVATVSSRDVGIPKAEGSRQALYLPGHNSGNFAGSDVPAPITTEADHDHGTLTGGSTPSTNTATVTVNSWSSGALDFRPAFIGFLFIMKVR